MGRLNKWPCFSFFYFVKWSQIVFKWRSIRLIQIEFRLMGKTLAFVAKFQDRHSWSDSKRAPRVANQMLCTFFTHKHGKQRKA